MLRTDITWLSRIAANAWIVAVGLTVIASGLVGVFGHSSHPFSSTPWFLAFLPLAAIGGLPAIPVAWTLFRYGGESWFRDEVGRRRYLALWSLVAYEGLAFALVVGLGASH